MAIAIRRPARGLLIRNPDGAVLRVVAPRAVRIEIFVPGDIARDVTRRHRAVLRGIAVGGPLVERVGRRRRRNRCFLQVRPRERDLLAALDRHLAVLAVGRQGAVAHRHRRRAAVRRDIDAVVAGLGHAERHVGRIDLVRRAARNRAHARRQRALGDFELRIRIVEIHHFETRRRSEPHGGRPDVDFRACVRIVPKSIARRQRTIDRCIGPIVLTGRFGRDSPGRIVQPCDPSGRIGRLRNGCGVLVRRHGLREGGLRGKHQRRDTDQGKAGHTPEGHESRGGGGGHGKLVSVPDRTPVRESTVAPPRVSRRSVL